MKFLRFSILLSFILINIRLSANEIILIRHAEVDIETRGWMTSRKASVCRIKYDTAPIHQFFPDTVLNKLSPRKPDTVYTSSLHRSKATARKLFTDTVVFVSSSLFDELELEIVKWPLILPFNGWRTISRITWLAGKKASTIETQKEARERVRNATDFIEGISQQTGQIVVVTHGFLIHKIRNKLKKRGWYVKQDNGRINLGATILEK